MKFNTMYQSLKRQKSAAVYTGVYFLRRLIFAFSLTFLENYLAFQLQIQVLLSFGVIVMLFVLKPIEGKIVIGFEVGNEIGLLLLTYSILPIGFIDFQAEDV